MTVVHCGKASKAAADVIEHFLGGRGGAPAQELVLQPYHSDYTAASSSPH